MEQLKFTADFEGVRKGLQQAGQEAFISARDSWAGDIQPPALPEDERRTEIVCPSGAIFALCLKTSNTTTEFVLATSLVAASVTPFL